MEKSNAILSLNLNGFKFEPEAYKIPALHETWIWEGDESVLPYKWVHMIQICGLYEKKGEKFELDKVKKKLKDEYYSTSSFDKANFIFITSRSQVMACAYLDKETKTIEYFLINPKGFGRGEENGLFSLLYKRCLELKIKDVGIKLDNSNVDERYFRGLGFR